MHKLVTTDNPNYLVFRTVGSSVLTVFQELIESFLKGEGICLSASKISGEKRFRISPPRKII